MKRIFVCFCLAAGLIAFAPGPAAADCIDECTYSSPCNQSCVHCVEEHIEYGCVRYAWSRCGNLGVCSSAPSSQASSFEQFLLTLPSAAQHEAR